MRVVFMCAVAALSGFAGQAEMVELSKARFEDKCKGAWAGQMFGVCFGAPYEFRSNGKPITKDLHTWEPERIRDGLGQDDCYVEMTFLAAIEEYGLDVTFEEAGQAFAATRFPLWHANLEGRENIRAGILPPKSGHPDYNCHADDIDFQIEADLFGILCPGLPRASNQLCDVFGHVMNYGDGVYGGIFVAGMYAAAYFEDEDVDAVLRAGLACVPAASDYRKCIEDVVRWHAEAPDDWLATWVRIEEKWQDDVDCMPGNPFNIDAKLNGAYIAMGLLYGQGDFMKTTEISLRCGQDADCNPSNAAGVLGCMKGFSGLPPALFSGLAEISSGRFIHTPYTFDSLLDACQRVAGKIIEREGGRIGPEAYHIPVQSPQPAELEQWTGQEAILAMPIRPHEIARWDRRWRVVACGSDMEPGVRKSCYGRESVLVLHPVSEQEPAAIEARLDIPADASALVCEVASHKEPAGDYVLRVLVDGVLAKETEVDSPGKWRRVQADVSAKAGETVDLRIENVASGWKFEAAYIDGISFR